MENKLKNVLKLKVLLSVDIPNLLSKLNQNYSKVSLPGFIMCMETIFVVILNRVRVKIIEMFIM